MATNLLTTSERRDFLTPDELWTRCRDAARVAVRAPFSPDDRAECVADLFSDAVATVADETAGKRHGRPADVLAHIGRVLASDTVRQAAAMPLRSDRRFCFTSLRNRAENWRQSREAARDRDALMSGRDTTAPAPADDTLPLQYMAAGAAQSQEVAHRAALAGCRALHMTGDYGVYLLLYQWARATDAHTAAEELDMTHTAYRQATSRAAGRIREGRSIGALVLALIGAPRYVGDALVFALVDASRDAHGRTPILAPDPRDGTDAGEWPTRPLDGRAARAACRISTRRPAPVGAAERTRKALDGRDADELRAQALARLGAALDPRADVHAGTGARKARVGRTSGRAPERYAPRTVRLGTR